MPYLKAERPVPRYNRNKDFRVKKLQAKRGQLTSKNSQVKGRGTRLRRCGKWADTWKAHNRTLRLRRLRNKERGVMH